MDIQDALKWTDDLIFAKTGQHLDSLQKAVLKGTWQGQKYPDIAKNCNRTHDHVRQVARKLWRQISEELEENVRQSNFRAIFEQIEYSHINLGSNDGVQIGNVNFCRENCPHPKTAKQRSPTTTANKPEKLHDLTDAPKYNSFYHRTKELNKLKQWILEENSPIVTIIGLSGTGKTALARQLVEEIKDNFQRVFWRSHRQISTLNSLKTNLKEFFGETQKTKSQSLINCLRSHRSLIVIDDLQETFTRGELAGTYLPEYENYGQLLTEIGQASHNSCFLLLSWEKPREIATLEKANRPCHALQLKSLGNAAKEILKAQQLTDENRWLELINRYSGNPLWLNIISSTIQDLFNGSVAQFLDYPALFLGDLEPILKEHFQRLCESEKLVILWLANQESAADISSKPPDLGSEDDFLTVIQSLRKRGLIEKVIDNGRCCFTLQPVIKEYVKKNQ